MRRADPKVSVIIPSYNSAQFLPDAIESVLAQTYRNTEVIVVNDGSTDSTRQVVNGYGNLITYIEQPNGGAANARNAGLSSSLGEYIAFLDADDIWLPHKLEKQMATFSLYPDVALVYSQMINFDEVSHEESLPWPETVHSGKIFDELLVKSFILLSSVVLKASVIKEVGGFDEDLITAEDTNLYLRIGRKFEIAGQNEVLVRRRMHGGNLSERVDIDIGTLENLDKVVGLFPDTAPQYYPPMKRAYVSRGKELVREYFHKSEYAKCHAACKKVTAISHYEKLILIYWCLTLLPPFLLDWVRKERKGAIRP